VQDFWFKSATYGQVNQEVRLQNPSIMKPVMPGLSLQVRLL
jgi:hypothetical protein